MLTLLHSHLEDFTNSPQKLQNQVADAYVKLFITAWFWPYYVMGNLDEWQKLGITLNGARPIKC